MFTNENTSNQSHEDNIAISTVDLAQSVPVEEQAVTEEAICTTELNVEVVTVENMLDSEVPDDEKAMPSEDDFKDLIRAEKAGCFIPVIGMANIRHIFKDRVYASLSIDENGEKFIEFCEKYENGLFSPKMRISQAELLLADLCGYNPKNAPSRSLGNKVSTFLTNLTMQYLGGFEGQEVLDMTKVLSTLVEIRAKLPVHEAPPKVLPPKEFYQEFLRCLGKLEFVFARKAYYALTADNMERIAGMMKMKKLELAKQLKAYNLLYLGKNAKGYQTNIRIPTNDLVKELRQDFFPGDNTTEWCYCVYRPEYISNLRKGTNI